MNDEERSVHQNAQTTEEAPVAASATEYARAVVERGGFSWPGLERSLFARTPSMRGPLDDSDAELESLGRPGAMARDFGGLLLAILPLIVPGIIVVPLRLDADPVVPFLVAAALALAHVAYRVGQWRQRAWRGTPSEALLCVFSVLLGVFGGWMAVVGASSAGQTVSVITASACGLMVLSSLVTVVVIRRRDRSGTPSAKVRHALPDLKAATAALPAAEQAALQEDLDSALGMLSAASVITDEQRDAAREVPLGQLTRWAWVNARRFARRSAER